MTATHHSDDWNEHWTNYSSAASSNPAQHFRFKTIRSLIAQIGPGQQNATLIDIGCGNGDFLSYLSTELPTLRLVGIEPSNAGSAIALTKPGVTDIRILDILQDDVTELANARAQFIVCTEVLEHLDNPLEFVSAIGAKLMAPETTLVISVPGGPRSTYDRHIGHRQHFTKKKLEFLFAAAGFRNVRVFRAGFPFFNLYKLLVILLGQRIVTNPQKYAGDGTPSFLSRGLGFLMSHSPQDSPFGWQLFALAEKPN